MVALDAVRAHNSSLKSLAPGLVAVFVGGTSGIGFSTAREFVRNTQSPHVYLIGRNQNEATRISEELRTINTTSKIDFIKSDVSLLKSVDDACKEIKEKEQKVNLLFMTAGYLTTKGRDETIEGLDKKFSLHYYARMRFIDQLSPLLTAAANDANPNARMSSVLSVLSPQAGRWFLSVDFDDLSLKNNFTIRNCATHAAIMNNFAIEHFAKAYPKTTFVHAAPGGVHTNATRDMGTFTKALIGAASVFLKPFMTDLTESGERHLYAATAPQFAPRSMMNTADNQAIGGDGVRGSGAYQLNWNSEVYDEQPKYTEMRNDGAEQKIWDHTSGVFRAICEGEGKY
ncbi:NAD(P)-binding protein [Aaosphaeria arxii CBS 175.79]|uniref:NAD(P)-binding protein n=1 Tax=Aaosphaeria arxii CBS 175.79 TaxID=1450172 RepID=A0A6A5YA57_9PLEO|nr:NAD(P)-binding protein [Aaosphaeria arxii CBS 175.79]KAF2022229.1 NAD(P)-binding protein [Aaosphaeria arxii CBS 175.79]